MKYRYICICVQYIYHNRNSSALIYLAISCLNDKENLFFGIFVFRSFDKVSRDYSLRRSVPNFPRVARPLKRNLSWRLLSHNLH